MDKPRQPIDEENARRVAQRFILDRYPYSNIAFARVELKTCATQQYYELAGYSSLAKWPASIATKRLCEVQVDAHSADVISYQGL